MSRKSILDTLLDLYPKFYYREEDGVHYKYNSIFAELYRTLKSNIKLVSLGNSIKRPIQIWRNQIIPGNYEILFEINMPDIKQVKLYDDSDTLLIDSGLLDEGTSNYSNSIHRECAEIIPTTKYYVTVEDYEENIFIKGFPENDEIEGDKYDHDRVLDVIGENLGVPRRELISDVANIDLPNTLPPYCRSNTEWDYIYQNRIIQHMEDLKTKPLVSVELYRVFGLMPDVEGRWRYLCRMNEHTMGDNMYMRSENWNDCVFDLNIDLDSIPKNIPLPQGTSVSDIMSRTFPLSKRGYVNLAGHSIIPPEETTILEGVDFHMVSDLETSEVAESVVFTPTYSPSYGGEISEEISMNLGGGSFDGDVAVAEDISMTVINQVFAPDTSTEILAQGTLSTGRIDMWGATPVIRIDTASKSTPWTYPTNGWNTTAASNAPWVNISEMFQSDSNGVACNSYVDNGYDSSILKCNDFHFNIPTNAKILGVTAKVQRNAGTANRIKDKVVKLLIPGNTTPGTNKINTAYWDDAIEYITYGGTTDTWGVTLTPEIINDPGFGIALQVHNYGTQDPHHAYYDYVRLYVTYSYNSAIYTVTVPASADGSAWDRIEATEYNDPNAGTFQVTYDIYNAQTGEQLDHRGNDNLPDIESMPYVDLRIVFHLKTSNPSYSPGLHSIKIFNKKTYNSGGIV